MPKPELTLCGYKNSPLESERIIFDVWRGWIRMKKIFASGKMIDWTVFTKEESKQIVDFFTTAIKKLK